MEDVKRILVVSRDTKYCRKAVQYGVSLSRKYGAELYVIHMEFRSPGSMERNFMLFMLSIILLVMRDGICLYHLWWMSMRNSSWI
jgi:nucleotide-binding universal stress UspA family protein